MTATLDNACIATLMATAQLRTVSYGGGVQSTALLVLAAQHKIDFNIFIFANVGDDSESPETLQYINRVAKPYAEANSLALIEVQNVVHNEKTTLLKQLDRRYGLIPMRMERSGAPASRICTTDFKITPVYRWLRRNGATRKQPALTALGISTDEIQRAKPPYDERNPAQLRTYPLLDLGLSRLDCMDIIRDAGLPVPGKSSCWFCPYTHASEWQRRRHQDPDTFHAAVKLEAAQSAQSEERGNGRLFLAKHGLTLTEVTSDDEQLTLGGTDGGDCESGYCWT